jgi:hypothetical protein
MIVELLKHASPFNAGEIINFPQDKAQDLIARGVAKEITTKKMEPAEKKSKTEKKAAE